jgi:hypothetical protein
MFQRKPSVRIIRRRTGSLNGKPFSYTFIQSPQAHSVRLKISINNGLEITVPRRFQSDHAENILKEHEKWIVKQLDKLEARQLLHKSHQLKDGSVLEVLGIPYTVKIIPETRGKPKVKRIQKLDFAGETAAVSGYELHVYCDGSVEHAKKTLEDFLRKVAEKYFARRTAELAEQIGVSFNNITIRGQKTRWGSCTRQKNLNFNWRLILLGVPVAESVIIHELAHTVHMNHSRSFYGLVEHHCPEYRKLQKHLHNPHFLV